VITFDEDQIWIRLLSSWGWYVMGGKHYRKYRNEEGQEKFWKWNGRRWVRIKALPEPDLLEKYEVSVK
jgi:hypothetical protein